MEKIFYLSNKLRTLIFILSLFHFKLVISQSCSGPFVFNSQFEVDQFIITNPTCAEIIGDVYIIGNDINNVEAFHNIEFITGKLYISGTILNNIWGFRNIRGIGNIEIWNVPLSNLNGLINLQQVDNDFMINGFNWLTDLNGLYNLHTIGGSFIIANTGIMNFNGNRLITVGSLNILNNNHITNLSGFEYLTTAYVGISLSDNQNLQNLTGFRDLISNQGYLYILNNPNLITTNGMNALKDVHTIYIDQNMSLANIEGFNSLIQANYIAVQRNPALTQITGFTGINNLGALVLSENANLSSINGFNRNFLLQYAGLFYNTALSVCHVSSICSLISRDPGSITIVGNAPGCTSVPVVQAQCSGAMKPEYLESVCQIDGLNGRITKKNSSSYTGLDFVSPNPSNGLYQIHWSNHIKPCFEVYNSQGKIIYHSNSLIHSNTIDITEQPSGIYFLHFCGDDGGKLQKLLKH